jgi:hypothetical protein
MHRISDDDEDGGKLGRRLKVALACAFVVTTLAAILGFLPPMP